jgi:hypothetical protein
MGNKKCEIVNHTKRNYLGPEMVIECRYNNEY